MGYTIIEKLVISIEKIRIITWTITKEYGIISWQIYEGVYGKWGIKEFIEVLDGDW